MSTRWYPLYQRGNPQLRVFLPNFWMKLIVPERKMPPNVVEFHCSMQMTKFDIKNYLEKIYNIKVMHVNTRIELGKTRHDSRQSNAIIKEDDRKLAYVLLSKDQQFEFPKLFKEDSSEIEEKNINEAKKDLQNFIEQSKAPSMPGWFRI